VRRAVQPLLAVVVLVAVVAAVPLLDAYVAAPRTLEVMVPLHALAVVPRYACTAPQAMELALPLVRLDGCNVPRTLAVVPLHAYTAHQALGQERLAKNGQAKNGQAKNGLGPQ
jgi:hypothetical protein